MSNLCLFAAVVMLGVTNSVQGLTCHEGFNMSAGGIPLYHWKERTCAANSNCFGQELKVELGMDVTMRYGACLSASYASYLDCNNLYGPNSSLDPSTLLNLVPDITQLINRTVQDFVVGKAEEIQILFSSGQGANEFIDGIFRFHETLGFNMQKAEPLKEVLARMLNAIIFQNDTSVGQAAINALGGLDTANVKFADAIYKLLNSVLNERDFGQIKNNTNVKTMIERLPGLLHSMLPQNWKPSMWYDVMFELLDDVNVTDWKQTAADMVSTINSSYDIPIEFQQFFDSIPDLVENLAKGKVDYIGNWTAALLTSYSEQDSITNTFSDSVIRFIEHFPQNTLAYEIKANIKWIPGLFYKFFPGDKVILQDVYAKMADGFASFNYSDFNQTSQPTKLSAFISKLAEKITGRGFHNFPHERSIVINFSHMFYDLLEDFTAYLDKFFDILTDAVDAWPIINAGKVLRDLIVGMNGTVPREIDPLLTNLQPIITEALNMNAPPSPPISTGLLNAMTKMIDAYKTVYPDSPLLNVSQHVINTTRSYIEQARIVSGLRINGIKNWTKFNEAQRKLNNYLFDLLLSPIDLYFALFKSFNYTKDELTLRIINSFPEFETYIRLGQLLSADDIKQLIKHFIYPLNLRPVTVEDYLSLIQPTVTKITASITDVVSQLRKIFQPNSCKFGTCNADLCNGHGYIESREPITRPPIVVANPCESNPCLNGGTCSKSTMSPSFVCECPKDITGDSCQDDKRCTGCNNNADCIDGKCQCKTGSQGDGKSCTGQCKAISLASNEVPPSCGVPHLSFGASLEDLSQYSNEVCDNGRSVATIKCITTGSLNLVTRFSIVSLNCVPCSTTLSSATQQSVPSNATAVEVETSLKVLEVLTTANKTPAEVADTTKYLKNLADALNKNDSDGNPKQITEQSMKDVMEVVQNLGMELEARENQNKNSEITSDEIESTVTESSDNKEIRESTRKATQLIDSFARNVDLRGKEEVTITTRKISLKIQQPINQAGSYEKVIFEPEIYTDTQLLGSNGSEPVVFKKKVVKLTIPPEAIERMNEIVANSGLGQLKLVMILHEDASMLTVDKRTGKVVQVTFKPGETAQSTPIGTTFTIEYKDPPKESLTQNKAVEDNLLALHKEYFCVFWDYIRSNWATEGCTFHNEPTFYCECNHFTSFALLLRVTTRLENYEANSASEIYSTVACALSAFCLFVTVFIYLIIKDLRVRRPTPIMVNMCLNLAVAYVMFIVGMDGRYRGFSEAGCYVSAVIMHITFLCSWFWMLIYSLGMYFALVKVIGTTPLVSKKAFMYTVGYGIPVVIVAIDLAVSTVQDSAPKQIDDNNFESHYIASHICWLRHYSIYLGFALPVGLIVLINIILFIVIIRKLTCKGDEIQSSRQGLSIKQQIFMAVTMITMMGLTWIFGYLMLISDDATYQEFMSIVFNIFNTAQGIVIFLVSCVRQKTVRNLWLKPFLKCCGRGNESPHTSQAFTSDSGTRSTSALQKDSSVL